MGIFGDWLYGKEDEDEARRDEQATAYDNGLLGGGNKPPRRHKMWRQVSDDRDLDASWWEGANDRTDGDGNKTSFGW